MPQLNDIVDEWARKERGKTKAQFLSLFEKAFYNRFLSEMVLHTKYYFLFICMPLPVCRKRLAFFSSYPDKKFLSALRILKQIFSLPQLSNLQVVAM